MGFHTPVDYFSAADAAMILNSSTENRSAQEATAQNARGDIIAREIYGEKYAPNVRYRLSAAVSKAIVLGVVTTPQEGLDPVVLLKVSVKTSAGAAPEIEYSGESLQTGATQSSTIASGSLAVSALKKAQILMSAFTLSGDGCELNECSAEIACKIVRAEVSGETVSHDVCEGLVKISATVVQTGSTPPVITPAEGFDMTSPESSDDPDTDYRTWKFDLTKSLSGSDGTTTTTAG